MKVDLVLGDSGGITNLFYTIVFRELKLNRMFYLKDKVVVKETFFDTLFRVYMQRSQNKI